MKSLKQNLLIVLVVFLPTLLYNTHGILSLVILIMLITSFVSKQLFILQTTYILASQLLFTHIHNHWGSHQISSRIEVIFESPTYEIIEYFKNYIDIIDILLLLHIVLVIFMLKRYQIKNIIFSIKKIKYFFSLILLISFSFFILKVTPTNIIKPIYEAFQRDNLLEYRLNNIKQLKKVPYKIASKTKYSKIVIIIGESASKNHMSIYSYNKNTTPFLKTLKPYVFNAISPANLTRYSVPILISDVEIKNWNEFFTSQSIVSTLKQAGYYTYWISNQRARGTNDSFIASIAHEANKIYFLNQNSKNYSNKDKVVIKKLNTLKVFPNRKEAFFIHIMGSHSDYHSRYEQNKKLIDAQNIFEEYDNTIFYTDYIISKIYSYFTTNYPKENILLVYFSDHAEIISTKKHGHGFSPSHKEEYEIPFIIYSNIKNQYLDLLKIKNKKYTINLESLVPIIVNTLNENAKYKISYSSNTICVSPNNIVNYKKLELFSKTK